jgi:hypothetical protein
MGVADKESMPVLEEVREHFLAELNLSLRRSGMYGGEVALRFCLDAVGFIAGHPHLVKEESLSLKSRGAFFSSGVQSAFRHLWGTATDDMIASVYAEIARQYGWLRLDRPLSQVEYEEVASVIDAWCDHDHGLSDILAAFGSPSIQFGGGNPRFPNTLAYMTKEPDSPSLSFHLWNGFSQGMNEAEYSEPVLLAIRREGGRFTDSFTFTPAGRRHLKTTGSQLRS